MRGKIMRVRARFMCGGFAESVYSPGARVYVFHAVTDDDGGAENARYYKASPNGQLSITVDNPEVSFERGQAYYLDFVRAGDSEPCPCGSSDCAPYATAPAAT
jgi:hypothetical protein